MAAPTFEEARVASRNGRERLGAVFQGRYLTYRVRTFRGRSTLDFDLFSGNHDLRPEMQDHLWQRYRDYCSAFAFRPKIHSHFSKTSLMCDVRTEHAQEWFALLWDVLSNVHNLSRIRCEFLSGYATKECGRITAAGILTPYRKVKDGALVRAVEPAFRKIIELLQFDYEILHSLSPRQFEELVAAAYDRIGCDKVILTPRSEDHGRDVIVEKEGFGTIRLFVEVKRYGKENLVTAGEVRSLLGTLATEPPSTKAIFVTTSDFAPRLKSAPNIAPLLGSRLELLNGEQLIEHLVQIEHSSKPPTFGF